jgi:hypothetical protein
MGNAYDDDFNSMAYDVDICNKAYDDENGLSYPYLMMMN